METLKRKATISFFASLVRKGLLRSQFFPYRQDLFFKAARCAGKLLRSHKICLPWKESKKLYQVYLFPSSEAIWSRPGQFAMQDKSLFSMTRVKQCSFAQSCSLCLCIGLMQTEIQSNLFIKTFDITTKFVIMTIWMERFLSARWGR